MRLSVFVALVSAAVPAFAAPNSLVNVKRATGETSGKYIVVLKQGVARANVLGNLRTPGVEIAAEWDVINGFASELDDESLNALRANPDVSYITEDGFAYAHAEVTQSKAPWGLGRISQDEKLANQDASALNFTYTCDDSAGAGVDVYVVDSGIYIEHNEFGGRARWGATFGGHADEDGTGHGTHCAGIVGGATYGVAKNVSLIAVRVLSDAGSGPWSDIISGLNWVWSQAQTSGRPSVVSMSIGGGPNQAVDDAVSTLTNGGVHVVVSAGNDNTDSTNQSPARNIYALTVGASTIGDAKASYSNFGPFVDVFAPGSNVISSYVGNPSATASRSGTSMACPHVAGLAAYLIAKDGNCTPGAIAAKISDLATKGALTGLPSGTYNYLARNKRPY